MPAITNKTPFSARVFGGFDSAAREHLVVVVNMSFDVPPGESPSLVDDQPDIQAIDQYRGDPTTSSVTVPGQFALKKMAVDVVVTGHACAPYDRAVERMQVALRVGAVEKVVTVTGDRFWRLGASGRVPSAPRPFVRMPLVFERAFGGGVRAASDEPIAHETRNPVGIGVPGAVPVDPDVETEVPNLEFPLEPMTSFGDRVTPACFGAIGASWQPRVRFAGTYDATWLKTQAPLLPKDFDPRFCQVVTDDQQLPSLQPGQQVEVIGMTPEGRWQFTLPRVAPRLCLLFADRIEHADAIVDTVRLEPDRFRVHLTARLQIPVVRNRAPLAEVVLGDISHAQYRSHYSRKFYYAAIGQRGE